MARCSSSPTKSLNNPREQAVDSFAVEGALINEVLVDVLARLQPHAHVEGVH